MIDRRALENLLRDSVRNSSYGKPINDETHPHGLCVTDPDTHCLFVKIPKNVSSWSQTFLVRHLLWQQANFHEIEKKTALVCLRDPVSRWVSGMVEYLFRFHKNYDISTAEQRTIDFLLDGMVFDPHTQPQTYFLDGLKTDEIIWFWCDDTYETKFLDCLGDQGLLPPEFNGVDECVYDFTNDHNSIPAKKNNYNFLENLINTNTEIAERVKNFYKFDYQLIKSVQFYNGNN